MVRAYRTAAMKINFSVEFELGFESGTEARSSTRKYIMTVSEFGDSRVVRAGNSTEFDTRFIPLPGPILFCKALVKNGVPGLTLAFSRGYSQRVFRCGARVGRSGRWIVQPAKTGTRIKTLASCPMDMRPQSLN